MATAETRKAKSRLNVLSSSLDELEAAIEPLFSGGQTLPEILLTLDPIQQAKLQTVLPYIVYDLIFIYLKSRGIDPRTHSVITELDRVRQYFEKIKNAENPPVRTNQVDKAAASRFIKHAISQAQLDADTAGVPATNVTRDAGSTVAVIDTAESGPSSTRVPVKITSKMVERKEWEQRVREAGSEEEDGDLEGWEDDSPAGSDVSAKKGEEINQVKVDKKGKGKSEGEPAENAGGKRRRQTMDPFAASGYGEESEKPNKIQKQVLTLDISSHPDSTSVSISAPPTDKKSRKKRKKKINTDADMMDGAIPAPASDSNAPTPSSGTPTPVGQSTKAEKRKKAKKKAERVPA